MNYTRVTETIGGANCTIYKVEKNEELPPNVIIAMP